MTTEVCLVCGEPQGRLCSSTCVDVAMRERDRNVRQIQRLGGEPDATARRYALALRNGEIASALISRRPQLSARQTV